jgi:hypothetical protein
MSAELPMSNIYRFNFDNGIVSILKNFSKIHQYDDIETYKESWKLWVDENKETINRETDRLVNSGYEGDVLDKLYKSGRYYFRNKKTTAEKPKKRRPYISIDYNIIALMDEHINKHIKDEGFTPANGYDSFCNNYKEALTVEIITLNTNTDKLDKDDLIDKIKKTYKNRYFIISRK